MSFLDPVDVSTDDACPHCGHEVGGSWLVCAWCGEQLAAEAELRNGDRLGDGRYQILRVIGRGGFGITYDVGDRRLQRRVAMKELFPESAVRHGSMVLTPPLGGSTRVPTDFLPPTVFWSAARTFNIAPLCRCVIVFTCDCTCIKTSRSSSFCTMSRAGA